MPAPVATFSKALGRTLYRGVTFKKDGTRGYGFVSKETYEAQVALENHLKNQLGRAPTGLSWVQIAAKYYERFEDYVEGAPGAR